jgi:hypothetical protein
LSPARFRAIICEPQKNIGGSNVPADLSSLLAAHGDSIERAIAIVRRRARVQDAEFDDFAQDVWAHLLENDGEVLRRFEGRSAAETYYVRVAIHVLMDIRRRRDGQWRPSRRARRFGPVAIELETLVNRDRLSPHEAIETMNARRGVPRAEAQAVLAQLESGADRRVRRLARPDRPTRDLQSENGATISPEQELIDQDDTNHVVHTAAMIERAWGQLSVEDRVSLALRFAGPAPQRPGPPDDCEPSRARKALRDLRDLLASAGVEWPQASLLLRLQDLDLGLRALSHGNDQVSGSDVDHPVTRQRNKARQGKARQESRQAAPRDLRALALVLAS